MVDNLRFELSFKNINQLEEKLKFCLSNKIDKINIPCKGTIKKDFLNETMEYIAKNYSELDVIYHYSLYHQYAKNREHSYSDLLNFIQDCVYNNNQEILLVSGSNKKKNFETIGVMKDLKKEKDLNLNVGIAYNPYLKNYFSESQERERFKSKFSTGLVKSIWLQFGTDIALLEREINYLKKYIKKNNTNYEDQNMPIFGSLLIPSRQFISRFRFRPWKGVFISESYLNSLEGFRFFIRDLINVYIKNGIYPVIETEFCSLEILDEVRKLFKF